MKEKRVELLTDEGNAPSTAPTALHGGTEETRKSFVLLGA